MGRYKPFGFLGKSSKTRKNYKKRKSLTTGTGMGNLYGESKKIKKSKKKTKNKLQAEQDPWALMELEQQRAASFDKAKAYVEGLPTPDLPNSYEDMYLKSQQGFGHDTEGHFEAKRKDQQNKRNSFVGPPSMDDMMSGSMAAYGAPRSIMQAAAKDNPLGTAMMFEQLSKEFPHEYEDAKTVYPSVAGKHQEDKEARMMKGKKKSTASIDDIMKMQRDASVIGGIQNNLTNAKQKLAMGGKKKYKNGGPIKGGYKTMRKHLSSPLDVPSDYLYSSDSPVLFNPLNSNPFDMGSPYAIGASLRAIQGADDYNQQETLDNSIYNGKFAKAGKRRALRTNQVEPMQAQSIGMQNGGKMKYNMAGMLPGAVQGMMGTAAMQDSSSFQELPMGHKVGRIMQGASGLANLIPGAGPLVGMGLNLVGGALQTFGAPEMTDPARMNQNPMGMATGGEMPHQSQAMEGGQMKPLSNQAHEVKANNPMQTDSVDAGNVMLDDSEVVVKDKVFSDTLKNPQTNLTFAQQEKMTQKVMGNFEKFRRLTGDTEMKDDKYHKRNTENLFNTQEQVAAGLGLRNEDGTPKQMMTGNPKEGFAFGGNKSKMKYNKEAFNYGGKMGYYTGGGFSPGPGDEDRGTVQSLLNSLMGAKTPYVSNNPNTGTAFTAETGQADPYGQSPQISNTYAANAEEDRRLNRFLYPEAHYPDGSTFAGSTYGGEQGRVNPLTGLTNNTQNPGTPPGSGVLAPNGPLYPVNTDGLKGVNFNPSRQLRSGEIAPVDLGIDPTGGGLKQGNQDAPPNLRGNDPTQTNSDVAGTNPQGLLEAFKGYNPFGEKATQMGEAISGLGLAANRPFYVNYGDVGREEINQQNIALQRAKGGEQAAVNDTLAQQKAAREGLSNRNYQVQQANLSNLSSRTGNQLAKTRGAFARQEAGMRTQIGARRTAIEGANLNTQKYQDDINTREYDSLWTENLKNMTNLRNMQLERQFSFNKYRKDQELMKLLKTQDFEYDAEGNLKFKQRKTNIAGREGDKTNNKGGTYGVPQGQAPQPGGAPFVDPALKRFGAIMNQSQGLATGKTGAAIPFSQQYANPLAMYPYQFQSLKTPFR